MKIVADENIPFVVECFCSIGEVEVAAGSEMTPALVADADILLVRSVTNVDFNLLSNSRVRFVGTATIGFEHIDTEFLKKRNIGFASAPGSNANSVAEYVVAALLSIGRKHKIQLEGKSIGVIGVGNVGSRVVAKCGALGMKCVLNDPPLKRQTGDQKYRPLAEVFDCDIVTLHTPLTFEGIDKTYHLADEKFFNSLKTGCVFINTARGAVADTTALKNALHSGKLDAAVLDVWKNEPDIDIKLLDIVDIATPHIAGYSLDGKIGGMIMIYEAACQYFGLETKFDTQTFLPAPQVRKIEIEPDKGNEQEMLLEVVEKVYDIKADDAGLRRILKIHKDKRGEFFSKLRKEYPVRREFQNTKIKIATENTEDTENKPKESSISKTLSGKLEGIGFLLSQE